MLCGRCDLAARAGSVVTESNLLVDLADVVHFLFQGLDLGQHLFPLFLKMDDVIGSALQEGYLAILLIRGGQDIFQPGISFPELIAPSLLGFDALTARRLLSGVCKVFNSSELHTHGSSVTASADISGSD
jgi:hypothetical protein